MGGATLLSVSKLSVVELSWKDRRIAIDEYSRLVVFFFYIRSKFDPVMSGQRSIFWKTAIFQLYKSISQKLFTVLKRSLHQRILRLILSRPIYCSGILIKYLSSTSSRKGTTPPSTGKTPEGKMSESPWLTSGTVKRPIKLGYVKNEPRIWSQDLKKPPKPPINPPIGKYCSAKVSDLGWSSKCQDSMSKVR